MEAIQSHSLLSFSSNLSKTKVFGTPSFPKIKFNGRIDIVSRGMLVPRKFMQRRKKVEVFKDAADEADQKNWKRLMKEIEESGSVVSTLRAQRTKGQALPKDIVLRTLMKFKKLKKWNIVSEILEWLRCQHWWDFNELDFLLLITAYGKLGDFIRAERVLKYMNKHGYPPSVISHTALMEAYGTGGQYNQAESIFRRMQSSGPEPSPLTYHIMLKICVKGNRYKEAEEIFETLLNDEMSCFKPDQQMFNLMIYMYGKAGSYDQARKIFGKMAERGIPRSARTFNSLMSFETNYKEVSSIYDQMQRADIQPDVVSYTFLIRAYAKARREEEALAVFEEMLDASVRPTLDAYNTLLDAFAISGMVEQARTVLKSMRRDRCTPNLHSYTMMLSAFVNASDMDGAEKFFRQIKQDGFKPNVVTYGTLMKGYGKVNNLEKMMSVYEEMRMQGIKPNEIIFTTIMDAHGKNEDFGSAVVWFKEMQTSEFPPDQKAKNVLLSLAKSAEEKKEADELVGNAIQDLREEEVCDFSEFNDADRDDAVQNFGPFEEQQDGLVLTNNDHSSTAEITESTEFDDDDEDDDYSLLDFVSFKDSVLGS
ncbi:hypothetical protein CKAN_01782100 [Cinnamomum micranthum f. kanehirae]|uniref:Pentatricopeptide repeat-containing protein n=2 Tax=Lauraceae TaxID=3433 RepID=A0A443PDF8_9MAGN|nr:hypothetical protein CKAN_01782100 [Cinnamomum micranthum f. kanehirae]